MKLLLLVPLIIGIATPIHAGIYYQPNARKMAVEVKCQDGKAHHYIQIKPGRILELTGHGNDYFKKPELDPFNVSTVEWEGKTYECSHRNMNKEEADSYRKKAFDTCLTVKRKDGCKGWN